MKYRFILIFLLFIFTTANAQDRLYMKSSDTIADLLNHPALQGFARHMLPRERDVSATNTRLDNTGALMPYHTNIDTDTVVAALNHMIEDSVNGKTIFYDFYSDSNKPKSPDKKSTGLFFFRGKPNAPFAIICPGGGFSYVGSFHEGFPYAMVLSKKGYNAFVLQYQVGNGGSAATQDLAAAVSYIFRNAESLRVDTKNYSIWGSSAGARMAAYIGSNGTVAYGGDNVSKPIAVIMAYTGQSDFTKNDPPTFAIVGTNDTIASPSVMEKRINAMRNAGINVQFNKYPNVGHGFGLGVGTSADGWIDEAVTFWEKYIK